MCACSEIKVDPATGQTAQRRRVRSNPAFATLWKSFALCHVVRVSCTGPPAPPHSHCWEAAALGEGFGRAPCTSSVFLAPAPPDCGPACTIVKNKNPGGAPARGTQLSRLLWVGVCCWGGDLGVVAESGTAWHVGKGCCQGLRDCSGTMSPASTYGYWWWRAPLVLGSSILF